ncbi:cell surface immobilization antigen (macronuclear) [Tetrahymena thermophila SB210]|uniref:Cell surface immobilization antigen n=1 Tax=Tetrahymena thermophila (strain SB210) TaxID=312017 RepID=Q22LP9_TETTS|nr:cell surface immobilization antigen [Tetrahymena thermophila SB210]EAR86217.1 cell surface immobilization antigen [Tetrahymena thermophila SB210]|eukprot:XP_976812.1 cell surface immobilization antigen [Tetrahymena thermophila SB210]
MSLKVLTLSLLIISVTYAASGNAISCGTGTADCTTACPASYPLPQGCAWSGTQPSCVVSNCDCSTTNLTDSYCQSCKGTLYYANTAMNTCVQSSASCNNRNVNSVKWTTQDCQTCSGNTKQKAKSDGSACINSSKILISSLFGLLLVLFA